jgi:hypothetical protein
MVIPRPDPAKPGPPLPNGAFLDALCHWLEPRRLVTTELFLRGPAYRGIWISVGIEVEPGRSIAEVRSAVEAARQVEGAVLDRETPMQRFDGRRGHGVEATSHEIGCECHAAGADRDFIDDGGGDGEWP